MCDLAYVMQVEERDRLSLAEWQAAAVRSARELPDVGVYVAQRREAFDAMLCAEPVSADDSDEAQVRRALGVG